MVSRLRDRKTESPPHKSKQNTHRNKWWEIKTTNNEEGRDHSVDYQDNDNTEPVCSSDKHGSVGLAIDTTS